MGATATPKGPGIRVLKDQEVFDEVARHLLTQGKRSMGMNQNEGGESCMYRGADGLKCAVGCLIPDANYDSRIEGHGVEHVTVRTALGGIPRHDAKVRMLARLQNMHDTVEPELWGAMLDTVASEFRLKPWPRETVPASPKVGVVLPFPGVRS